ncbi:hypothetical protein HPP92_028064 [Vanilla planifolia]|uniref:Uncharacterized protein n=1 Tax=Vanilla planifolia TaxID=51239 RepID=A0A835P9C1_VANPL|nr:hypothetical protein HPP92_028064 [Vanilla planifolia]
MEPGGEVPLGDASVEAKEGESQRRRRERKDSIVSTTELLRPEERDADECDGAAGDETESKGGESAKSSATEDGEEGRRFGFGRERTQDLPGSPSFRFYFADSVEEPTTMVGPARSMLKRESCEFKAPKKEKGKRFMALPKVMSLNN